MQQLPVRCKESKGMEKLIEQLRAYGNLNITEVGLIKSNSRALSLKKGSCFSESGKVANKIGFLTEGVMCIRYYDSNGDDIIKYFVTENHFVVDTNSFRFETPSSVYFEALTDCTLITFSKETFLAFADRIGSWNDIFLAITTAYLTEKVRISREMLALDAKSRYLLFLENFPGLANRIPLSGLASYLGITQSSLSRIRKNIF